MDESEPEAQRREAEHRVKNTLQLISSILMLQSRRAVEPAAQAALKAVLQRVSAVSLAHRHVDEERIELAALIRELATDLARSAGRDGIAVELDLEPVTVPARDGAPVALWVSEAIANALRHAYPDGREGRVQVRLGRTPGGYDLSVSDTGVGLADTPRGFGSTILQLMAQQLRGRFTAEPQPGCRIAVHVPMEESKP